MKKCTVVAGGMVLMLACSALRAGDRPIVAINEDNENFFVFK